MERNKGSQKTVLHYCSFYHQSYKWKADDSVQMKGWDAHYRRCLVSVKRWFNTLLQQPFEWLIRFNIIVAQINHSKGVHIVPYCHGIPEFLKGLRYCYISRDIFSPNIKWQLNMFCTNKFNCMVIAVQIAWYELTNKNVIFIYWKVQYSNLHPFFCYHHAVHRLHRASVWREDIV